jgi:putative NADPH-quinone reductase
MRKILALNGSPRTSGNTTHLLEAFVSGAGEKGVSTRIYRAHELNMKPCTGCLRCNVLKRCSQSGDDWEELQGKILEADVLVFAAPVYFHHLPAPMKLILDRFRSFSHVRITENGLVHTPHTEWKRDFVLILSQGSPDPADSRPVIDLFDYICTIMGGRNRLHVVTATRLAMVNQVKKNEEELRLLYRKLGIPESLAEKDVLNNREHLERCRQLGISLSL